MVPMTKEEYDKQQSVVREEVDEVTGRVRYAFSLKERKKERKGAKRKQRR